MSVDIKKWQAFVRNKGRTAATKYSTFREAEKDIKMVPYLEPCSFSAALERMKSGEKMKQGAYTYRAFKEVGGYWRISRWSGARDDHEEVNFMPLDAIFAEDWESSE